MDTSVLLFSVNGTLYAINTENIVTLTNQYKVEKQPKGNSTEYMAYLRGQVIPILDISKYLFDSNNVISKNSTLVVCDYDSKLFAFELNGVEKLIHIQDTDKIEPCAIMKSKRHLIDYFVHKDERLIGILDIKNMKEETYYDENIGHIQD